MTAAGQNCRGNIWRIGWGADDRVGGAVTTGTLEYQNVYARFQEQPEEQLILQQGLETTKIYKATIVPGTLDIRERDEFEVSQPLDHFYYGLRFRIINARPSDFNKRDPRNYILLTMTRSERAHDNQ